MIKIRYKRDGKTAEMQSQFADVLVKVGAAEYVDVDHAEPAARRRGRPPKAR